MRARARSRARQPASNLFLVLFSLVAVTSENSCRADNRRQAMQLAMLSSRIAGIIRAFRATERVSLAFIFAPWTALEVLVRS